MSLWEKNSIALQHRYNLYIFCWSSCFYPLSFPNDQNKKQQKEERGMLLNVNKKKQLTKENHEPCQGSGPGTKTKLLDDYVTQRTEQRSSKSWNKPKKNKCLSILKPKTVFKIIILLVYLRVQRGTLSGYSTPILSNPNLPSNPAKYPANAIIIFPRAGLESKKNVFFKYCEAYFP